MSPQGTLALVNFNGLGDMDNPGSKKLPAAAPVVVLHGCQTHAHHNRFLRFSVEANALMIHRVRSGVLCGSAMWPLEQSSNKAERDTAISACQVVGVTWLSFGHPVALFTALHSNATAKILT